MQRYLLFPCIAATALLASASGIALALVSQEVVTSNLTVQIAGARNNKGQIAIALFHDGTGFPGDKSKAFRTFQVRIDPQTLRAEATLKDLPPGVYAVSVFHDENLNGQLDKNVFGIPKEGYGASNNPKRSMGPPKFAEAKFQLDQPEKLIEISLLY